MKDKLYQYQAVCVRIVDGDTVDAMIDLGFDTWVKRRVRLHGINAPESRTRDAEEKKKGLESKARLKELILDEDFILESKGIGKYGRCLGVIHCHGHNINQQMIDEGYADEYE